MLTRCMSLAPMHAVDLASSDVRQPVYTNVLQHCPLFTALLLMKAAMCKAVWSSFTLACDQKQVSKKGKLVILHKKRWLRQRCLKQQSRPQMLTCQATAQSKVRRHRRARMTMAAHRLMLILACYQPHRTPNQSASEKQI